MSGWGADEPQEGWWLASDGRYYPPETSVHDLPPPEGEPAMPPPAQPPPVRLPVWPVLVTLIVIAAVTAGLIVLVRL